MTTDGTGYFSAKLPGNIERGYWFLRANANCPLPEGVLFKKIVPSEGRITFRVMPEEVKTETVAVKTAEVAPTEVVNPTETSAPIPSGAVQIPDVVGLSLNEATKKLEELEFGVTWIDGKSPMELGQVYQQKPEAGKYFVPHRTTVILYRTMEKNSVLRDNFYAEYLNVQKGWKSYGCERIYIQTLDDTYESSHQVFLKNISNSGELIFEQKNREGESSNFSITQDEQNNGIFFTNPGKKSYQIPESRGTSSTSTYSDSTLSPSFQLQLVANESILVMGKSIDTFVYEGKYTEITNGEMHYPDTNCTYVLTEENNIRYNIDPKSGLVLLMDLTYSTLSCSLNTGPCELDGFSGSIKTSLISTNHELGWEN